MLSRGCHDSRLIRSIFVYFIFVISRNAKQGYQYSRGIDDLYDRDTTSVILAIAYPIVLPTAIVSGYTCQGLSQSKPIGIIAIHAPIAVKESVRLLSRMMSSLRLPNWITIGSVVYADSSNAKLLVRW